MEKVELDLTNEIDLYILNQARFKLEMAVSSYAYTARESKDPAERKHAEESLSYNKKALERVKSLLTETVHFKVSK